MLNRKGQSTLEYAIVVAIIVGGLLAMQFYVKRGWEGKLKAAADNMGEQFEPAKYTATLTSTSNSDAHQTEAAGVSTTTLNADSVSNKVGQEALGTWTTGAGADLYEGQ
jgi:hypothetical protein